MGPRTPRWHATWRAIGKAARLSQRNVFVFGVESHFEWQDFYDGIGSYWAFAGNELADGLAARAATSVTIDERDQIAVGHLRGCTHLVHRRIAAATALAAAAAPPPPPRAAPTAPPQRRKLHDRLLAAGH